MEEQLEKIAGRYIYDIVNNDGQISIMFDGWYYYDGVYNFRFTTDDYDFHGDVLEKVADGILRNELKDYAIDCEGYGEDFASAEETLANYNSEHPIPLSLDDITSATPTGHYIDI